MACTEQDGKDKCPFFGDDPLVILVVVGVVEEGVEGEERKAVYPGGDGYFVVEGEPLYLGRDDLRFSSS